MNLILRFVADMSEYFAIIIVIDLILHPNIRKTPKNFIFSLLTYLSITILSYFLSENLDDAVQMIPTLLYIIKFLTAFLILYSKERLKIFYIAAITEFICAFLSSGIKQLLISVFEGEYDFFVSVSYSFIYLTVIVLTCILRNKMNCKTINLLHSIIPKHIYMLLLVAVICLAALVSLNNYPTSNAASKGVALNVVIIILSFVICSILISLFFNVISKQHFSNINSMLEKQVEIQIRHYDKLEKLNNEMRSFRHDYTNHLHSLLSLIKMKQYSDAEEYIEKLLRVKHSSQTMYYTGNKLADAILTDKADAVPEYVSIDYQGIIPRSIENSDLCVILSNSLDNAIEACTQYNSPCTISISAQERQGYFVMTIKNPTINPKSFSDIPETTKADADIHGIGLINIENVVKKYDGQMLVKCENHIFELSLAMKIVSEVSSVNSKTTV